MKNLKNSWRTRLVKQYEELKPQKSADIKKLRQNLHVYIVEYVDIFQNSTLFAIKWSDGDVSWWENSKKIETINFCDGNDVTKIICKWAKKNKININNYNKLTPEEKSKIQLYWKVDRFSE